MKKKILWLVVSGLMVVALMLASCAPATPVTEKPSTPTTGKPTAEKPAPQEEEEIVAKGPEMVRNALGKMVEKPKYGGVYIEGRSVDQIHFDEASLYIHTAHSLKLTNEDLLMGDWAKGPAGTGDVSWLYHWPVPEKYRAGCLAESWEIDGDTAVFHIRQGVHWQNKPPVNGRELTAEDVVYSLKRVWTIASSYTRGAYLWETHIESMTAPDKYTFVLKCKPGKLGLVWAMLTDHHRIVPHEVYPENEPMKDWEKMLGTGTFMVVDYVASSSMTFVRNPNYWGRDPVHPDNQLPYLDGIKWLIIPDVSTRMAALRTGKIDWLSGVEWEEAGNLKKTNPELKYLKWFSGSMTTIFWQLDRAPYSDIRVRRALAMAIDNQAIADEFYGGEAVILGCPIPPIPEFSELYIPLDKMATETREMYEYHPDKAKQLLADAGYPNGFKTEVVCYQVHVDILSIVQDYWAKIGVDMEIDVKEYGVWASMGLGVNKTYEHMFTYVFTSTGPFRFYTETPGKTPNISGTDDPKINEAFAQITEAWSDYEKQVEIYQGLLPHTLSMHFQQQLPTPLIYTFWQPWVKGYQGEYAVGYANQNDQPKYLWYDQDLKEELTGKR